MKNKIALILLATTASLSLVVAIALCFALSALGLNNSAQTASSPLVVAIVVVLAVTVYGAVSVAITLALINRMFIRPIEHLSNAMRTISATNNFSLRIPPTDASEVAPAINSINQMLNTAESYHIDMLNARYEVESANKGKSLFIAKVSHELRTPIHGITGMLRILMKQETASGKRQYIQMAQDSALTLLETINEILNFSKMQNGDLSLEQESFNLAEVIRSTVEHLIPRFEEKPELLFCWDISPEVPSLVIGDAARIRNILVNLLGNAFKFSQEGHVALHVRPYQYLEQGKQGVRFSVTDTGIGIPPSKLESIFDPFTTADEGTARLYAGTGLGLAIVKQITEKLGGSISVESTLGTGSTFSIDVPLESVAGSEDQDLFPSRPYTIAVVATPDIRQLTVAQGLRSFGCNVSLFSLDDHAQIDILMSNCSMFDIIHIIKPSDILLDELIPLLRVAAQNNVRVVYSVPSVEISSTDILAHNDRFFVTLQPTSALDILMMCEAKLSPKRSVRDSDEVPEKALQKLNILIADDAKTNQIILKALLEEAGHSVEVVENGKQLLDRIASKTPTFDQDTQQVDLVLTDIQMPVMDGMTATQNFRELERRSNANKKLPIVAVTSYAFPEECNKMLASGIDHILTKPINPKRLSRLISQITCESDQRNDSEVEEDSDRYIIAELCQITENLVDRMVELRATLKSEMPDDAAMVLDIQGVFERSGDSLRRTGLILSGFLESYQEQLVAMEATQLPVADPATFRRVVHSLKGLLLDAGAQSASSLAALLEERIVNQPQSVAIEEIRKLATATREAAAIIKEVVSALPSLEVFSALPALGDQLMLH